MANQIREVRIVNKSLLFFNYLFVLIVLFHHSLYISHELNRLDFPNAHFIPQDLPQTSSPSYHVSLMLSQSFPRIKEPQGKDRPQQQTPSSKHKPSLACATHSVSLNIQGHRSCLAWIVPSKGPPADQGMWCAQIPSPLQLEYSLE